LRKTESGLFKPSVVFILQAITEFCTFVGAASVQRARIIKLAKTNGDTLGFLV